MAVATSLMWISNLVVSLTFLSMAEELGSSATVAAYAAVCAFGLVFVYASVPVGARGGAGQGNARDSLFILYNERSTELA